YHFSNHDHWWGCLTIALIIPPMLVAMIWCIGIVIEHRQWSCLSKCFLVIVCVVCFPLTPVVLLLRGCVAAAQEKDPNDDALIAPQVIKLWEVIAEAYPQLFLQLYIVGQYAQFGIGCSIDASQILSITSSLLTLAFFLVRNAFADDALLGSKIWFFQISFYAFFSRLYL
ncbi:unnamed protein product, partial [Meganyctiphanes norvegica]